MPKPCGRDELQPVPPLTSIVHTAPRASESAAGAVGSRPFATQFVLLVAQFAPAFVASSARLPAGAGIWVP